MAATDPQDTHHIRIYDHDATDPTESKHHVASVKLSDASKAEGVPATSKKPIVGISLKALEDIFPGRANLSAPVALNSVRPSDIT